MNSKVRIASDNTGTVQFITDKINGLICKAGDVDSIEECLLWCLNDREKLADIGNNARKIYDENFSMEIQKRNIMKIVESI